MKSSDLAPSGAVTSSAVRALRPVALAIALSCSGVSAMAAVAVVDVAASVNWATALGNWSQLLAAWKTQFSQMNAALKQDGDIAVGTTATLGEATLRGAALQSDATTQAAGAQTSARIEDSYYGVDTCAIGGGAVGISDSQNAARVASVKYASGIGRAPSSSSQSALSALLAIEKGTVVAPAPEVAAVMGTRAACQSFVGAASSPRRFKFCTDTKLPPGNANGTPDADINAETLFMGPQVDPKNPVQRNSISSNPNSPDSFAMLSFLRNLNEPMQVRQLTPTEALTDAGRRFQAIQDRMYSNMSLATYGSRNLAGQITASTTTLIAIKELKASKQADFVNTFLSKIPRAETEGISPDALLQLEVERRAQNPQWAADLFAGSPEVAAKEHAQIAAMANYIAWLQLRESRVQTVLLGGLYGAQVRAELTPQVAAAHRFATSNNTR